MCAFARFLVQTGIDVQRWSPRQNVGRFMLGSAIDRTVMVFPGLVEATLERYIGICTRNYTTQGHMGFNIVEEYRSDRSLWSRHEMKYLISESTAAGITQYIKAYTCLDRYSEFQPNNAYMVQSVYFDSLHMKLCRESLEGTKNRFKLRIRSYTDDVDYPRFFEVKRRVNTIIIKSRARVMYPGVNSLLTGSLAALPDHDIESENLKQFLLYKNSISALPVVGVRYWRQAHEGITDDRVRITMDRELSYKVTRNALTRSDGTGWHHVPLNNMVILEIKFTGKYPAWIDRLVKYFGIKTRSVSKYANSIKHSCVLQFCAPKVSA